MYNVREGRERRNKKGGEREGRRFDVGPEKWGELKDMRKANSTNKKIPQKTPYAKWKYCNHIGTVCYLAMEQKYVHYYNYQKS